MRSTLTLLAFFLAGSLAAQDNQSLNLSTNSISALLAEKAPELQPGFAGGDAWMLYDWRFDLLSNGAQQFLLKKYGYLDLEADGLDSANPSRSQTPRGISKQQAGPAAAPAPGANIPVSQAFFRVGRRLQSETTIAASGSNILVGFNDGDLRGQAVGVSHDAGATWSGGRLPSYPGVVGNSGDPVLAVAPGGRIYHAYLASSAVGFLTIAVAYSDDGGSTWNGPVNASASLGGNSSSLDKPWMAVDNITGSAFRGNIYVACTRFVSSGRDSISFMRSTDGGKTFSQALAVTSISAQEANDFQDVQGSFISIGPNGEVYVIWYDTRVDGIRIAKSADGGATFSTPVTALSGIGFTFSFYVPGTFDAPAFGQVAVDTTSGANRGVVYVTANVLDTQGNDLDVMLARSADGGVTWDAPVRVNNDKTFTSQFQPALAVAANGNVGVAFYDRRNDPSDVLTDVYLAISSDSGKSFPTQLRVTTESSLSLPTPIGYRTGYHGDYNHMVASGSNFYLSWADDRNGTDPSVYMAVMPTSGALPDFTISAVQPFADILPGDTANFPLRVSASGVKLSATVTPATGLTLQTSGGSVSAASTPATAPGTYTITVTGDNGSIQRSTEARVTVHSNGLGRVPTPLTYTQDPSYNSQGAIDSQGNLHVVYAGSVIARRPKRITYVQVPRNGAPLQPVTLYLADVHSFVDSVQDPHVAVGPDGTIYVIWRHSDANNDAIVMSASNDSGKTFSNPADISSNAETIGTLQTQVHAFQPSLAVGSNGTVFVSFLRENFTMDLVPGALVAVRIDIGVIHSTDGGTTFSSVVTPTKYASSATGASVSTASPPVMTLDSGNNPYVVWAASLSGRGTDIYMARSRDGGATFDVAVNASGFGTTSITPRQPAITVDPNNVVYVAWNTVDSIAGLGDVLMAVSTDSQKFAKPANISNATYFSGAVTDWPAIQTDSSGNLIAVWREWINAPYRFNDTERDVFISVCSNNGASCTPPINISTSLGDTLLSAGGGVIQRPALAVDANGRIYVLYDDDTSGSTQVMLWTSPDGFAGLPTNTSRE